MCELLASRFDVDVNRQGLDGRTALHKAAVNGADECAAILLANKAKIDIMDRNGKKAADYAQNHPKIQSLLNLQQ